MRAYALAIFTGAFLLFQVQPLMGKFVLPWFGGSTGVWTTCMLFFQVLLLAGYTYAHLIARCLKPRAQTLVHVALLAAAVALLPIIPSAQWKPVTTGDPTVQILLLLTVCLGLPYFVLSATGPLMQEWFRRTYPGVSPYRLYSLSNVGSLLALVSYPLWFEPLLSRGTQAVIWGWGLRIFLVLAALCAAALWKAKAPDAAPVVETGPEAAVAPRPGWEQRILWFCLPACASVLLLATTNKICQDVAVIPFLWVLPLSLYLFTFILCFDNPRWYWRKAVHLVMIPVLGLLCYVLFEGGVAPLFLQIFIYALALFLCCLVCHGELYRLKPDPRHLTAYYLMIAAGGAAGGVLVAVVAPLLFNSYLEMHGGLVVFVLLLTLIYAREKSLVRIENKFLPSWKLAAAGSAGLALILGVQIWHSARDVILRTRNFYGVLRVFEYYKSMPSARVKTLRFGEITHGVQFLQPAKAGWLTAYYHEQTGVGLAMQCLPERTGRRIGVVGLGVGIMSAYGRKGDYFRFYEINPAVRHIAETEFTYLADSAARVDIVMGDARLSLEREPPQQFDLLVLDAFSNDSIPVHLLTREVLEIYRRHLKPDGVIAVHISNRHLNLRPVVENLARSARLRSTYIANVSVPGKWWLYPSNWVLVTGSKDFLESGRIRLAGSGPEEITARTPLWTDDHASLLRILK